MRGLRRPDTTTRMQKKAALPISEVLCPRKGPLGNIIAVTVCADMYERRPQACADCKCNAALQLKEIVEELNNVKGEASRGGHRHYGFIGKSNPESAGLSANMLDI